jgi:uncharacterized membrane protein YiaA
MARVPKKKKAKIELDRLIWKWDEFLVNSMVYTIGEYQEAHCFCEEGSHFAILASYQSQYPNMHIQK